MNETVQQYTQRILGHSQGKDPLRLLGATPAKLAALIKGKNKKQLSRRPAPDKWSVGEIVAHLADTEIVTGWRLRQILSTNASPIQAYDQEAWAKAFNYARRDPRQSVEDFRVLRAGNLRLLKSVPRKSWENYGVHQERGNETAEYLVRLIAGHDVNHLQQVEKILNGKH